MPSLGLGYYGSWLNLVDTITTNQENLNIWTYVSNLANTRFGWNRNSGKKLRALITINSGVNIFSTNPLNPAITIPTDGPNTFRTYDQILLINNGNILGAGGYSGSGGDNGTDGYVGGKGGTAIYTRRNFILFNNGNIYGGGGGGGGGGGAFQTGVSTSSTNCAGASYCGKCCILNCQGFNYCSSPTPCTPGAGCGSFCQYYTNASACNSSTVGTCNTVSRWCLSYKGGNGGRGQGYNSNFQTGTSGVIYGAGIFTGDGGSGGNWGQDGLDGLNGSQSNKGIGGEAGCWIDGYELITVQKTNDERGYLCNSSGSQTLPILWSGWSSAPSITTTPNNGSGVNLTIDGNNLRIEPRQSLTTILVNNPTSLGGQMDLSNCSSLQTLTCNTQNLASLNLTQCTNSPFIIHKH